MKLDTFLIIGAALAGVAAVAYLTRKRTGTVTAGPLTQVGTTVEIANDDLPGQAGYGWRYFSDGTSIDPMGNYYVAGNLVWKANQ